MRRALRILATACAAAALALGATAAAQSIGRGQALYFSLGCDAANCHGANPVDNVRNVMNGAGSPGTIEYAAFMRTEMNHLYAAFMADQTSAQDLAAWLRSVAPAVPPPPPPGPTGPTTAVVEYVHAGFGHYFVTALAGEIAALDAGAVAGWTRTGRSFKAYAATEPTLATVCRFFTAAFAPKSSHFYTPVSAECAGLRNGSRDWQYEGDAFFVRMPDDAGNCPAGSHPVYRLYNNGQSGAPNHRYTTDAAVRTAMLASGWLPEGYGPQGVSFCSPE
jgi:hypothetical protein